VRAQPPTFFLLNGLTGWRLADAAGRPARHEPAIRLPGDPNGPLALNSADGSLGGLVLPRGFAADPTDLLYLLVDADQTIRRFDPESSTFVTLPEIGSPGSEARQLTQAGNIAITGYDLYVADTGNARVQVFALPGLALRYVFEAPRGRPWLPADVTSNGRESYILDQRNGAVYAHRPGTDWLRLLFEKPQAARRWTRLAIDRSGSIHLLDPNVPQLEVFRRDGTSARESETDSAQAAGLFDEPLIRLDYRNRFCLPASLARLCARAPSVVSPEEPLKACAASAAVKPAPLLFDRNGNRITRQDAESPGPALYQAAGVWCSEPLDSDIARCQWHRIELQLEALPPGTRVELSTCTSDNLSSSNFNDPVPSSAWSKPFALTGPMQTQPGASTATDADFLVQSREGRYLRLRLRLEGDGYSSPRVSAMRIHYPRQSELDYLPAIYRQDPESALFLDRYLSIAQTTLDAVEARIRDIALYFDPKAVPGGAFLAYLAKWLALPIEGGWTWEQNRRLLEAAPRFYQHRGTPASLRLCLQAYLSNLSGIGGGVQMICYPQLLEDFRERRYLMLDRPGESSLGREPMWSAGVIDRCQLGVFATSGSVRMVSTGDPQHDFFQLTAHRFRVFVPAAWVRSAEDERKLRRAINNEKPAHTLYDLCLVEPRFRVGVQSTVGVDTVIGALPSAQLACLHDADVPASRQPRNRLGYDMVLGSREPVPPLQLGKDTRIGINSSLT
jgi:phage tail-like protein